MDAGGLQRLHKAARKTQRDAVAAPELATPPGGKAEQAWFGQRRALYVCQQRRRCFIVADVAAAVDVPIAGAVLQGNTPLPTSGSSRCACVRQELSNVLARHCEGAVAGQPVRPILI